MKTWEALLVKTQSTAKKYLIELTLKMARYVMPGHHTSMFIFVPLIYLYYDTFSLYNFIWKDAVLTSALLLLNLT